MSINKNNAQDAQKPPKANTRAGRAKADSKPEKNEVREIAFFIDGKVTLEELEKVFFATLPGKMFIRCTRTIITPESEKSTFVILPVRDVDAKHNVVTFKEIDLTDPAGLCDAILPRVYKGEKEPSFKNRLSGKLTEVYSNIKFTVE